MGVEPLLKAYMSPFGENKKTSSELRSVLIDFANSEGSLVFF